MFYGRVPLVSVDLNSTTHTTVENQTLTGIVPIKDIPATAMVAEQPVVSVGNNELFNIPTADTSNRSIEELIGEPGGQSTPVPSPERPKQSEVDSGPRPTDPKPRKMSRFDVKRVSEEKEVPTTTEAETETAENDQKQQQQQQHERSRSISQEAWRVSAEEEHYDSSPSPGSCYDTASESGPYGVESLPGVVEENLARQGIVLSVIV